MIMLFFDINWKISIIFYYSISCQHNSQKTIINVDFITFIYFEHIYLAKLLLIRKYVYNNIKIINITHTSFKINSKYHLYILLYINQNSNFKSRFFYKLAEKWEIE